MANETYVKEDDPTEGIACLVDENNDIAMSLQIVTEKAVYIDIYSAADERTISRTLYTDRATLKDWLEKAGVL